MRIYTILFIFIGLGWTNVQAQTEQFALVTKLGTDTVAVEYVQTGTLFVKSDAIVRSPELSKRIYGLVFMGGEDFAYEYESRNSEGVKTDHLAVNKSDSVSIKLPADDYIYWQFDHLLRKLHASGEDLMEAELLAGERSQTFKFKKLGDQEVEIVHPFRGSMNVKIDSLGRLIHLDAANTTRKVTVDRVDTIGFTKLWERYSAEAKEGKSFGELSGRGSFSLPVGEGKTLTLDFGQPRKRGREIFGKIVPYGKIWRTGANKASHLKTDVDLVIGGLKVPAGEYTLFTILEEGSGTLMINKQTGQNGRRYDESQDLGKVQLERVAISDGAVENFTIDVFEGNLRIRWDDTSWNVALKH